ncbi:MAG TPA: cell division protein FtsZ [Syntrophales bacterium]|jgi:cell division protein FtsZ
MFELTELSTANTARIKVIGIGGGGGNAVNTMISYNLKGVDFIVANTDTQALGASISPIKVQLGAEATKGLGAGANPDVGKQAAIEAKDRLREHLEGADMVFITAGLGGGTGTGGAPVIAEICKELGVLTVAVVTKPFQFEGKRRNYQAEEGIDELRRIVDTLIVVPNQRLLSLGGRNLSLLDAFKKADDILYHAVKGISDLIIIPGLINLDFADVKNTMSSMGLAMMGTGTASGENRAIEAAQRAISSPLLEDNSIQGAHGVLLNITGGPDMSLFEVNEASSLIQAEAHEDANIIFGTVIDETMGDEIRITVIATGFEDLTRRKNNLVNMASMGGHKREDLSKPAYLRKERSIDQMATVKMGVIEDNDDPDLEIPTFLRRQAD